MKLAFFKTLWGCPGMEEPGYESWIALLRRIKADGYDGIECSFNGLPADESKDEEFVRAVRESGLRLIVQIHTCTYTEREEAVKTDMGAYSHGFVNSTAVEDHVASLEGFLRRAKAMGAELANVHGGHDSWGVEKAAEYLNRAVRLAASVGIPMTHETHRRRVLWNPWLTLELVRRVPKFRINADLSHWCCACERVFDSTSDRSWPDILEAVASRCDLIHARVGHPQGPQVPHPAAPEFQFEVQQHLRWWMQIFRTAQERGAAEFRIEPEFGAPGYQRRHAFTCEPVEDLWEINNYVAGRVAVEFRAADPASRGHSPLPKPLLQAYHDGQDRMRAARAALLAHPDTPAPTKPQSQPAQHFLKGALLGAALTAAAAAAIHFLVCKKKK